MLETSFGRRWRIWNAKAACGRRILSEAPLSRWPANMPSRRGIEALLAQYAAQGVPMTCPHGRPVMIQMTRLEFEKLFKRVL